MSLDNIMSCLSHYKTESTEMKTETETIVSIKIKDRNNLHVVPKLHFKSKIIEHIIFDECAEINSIPSFLIKFTLKKVQAVGFLLNKQRKLQYDMQNSSIKQGSTGFSTIREGLIFIFDGFFFIGESLRTEYERYIEDPYNWICKNLPEKKNSLVACLGVKKENSFIKMSCLDDYKMFMNGKTTANFVEKTFIVFKGSEKLAILEGCSDDPNRVRGKVCPLDKSKTFKEILAEAYSESCYDYQQLNNPKIPTQVFGPEDVSINQMNEREVYGNEESKRDISISQINVREVHSSEESKRDISINQRNISEVHGSGESKRDVSINASEADGSVPNKNLFTEGELSYSKFK